MITNKNISKIVSIVVCLALLGSLLMVSMASTAKAAAPEYEKLLFNGEVVTIEIEADPDDWQSLLDNAQSKEYISADIIINGDRFSTVGIRTKGNSSLSQAGSSEKGRYSLQLNPGKYVSGQSFYGLDTMCLNNIISDPTYMKDYISYNIMDYLDVPAPLRNYANVSVNGEHYGLCLLLERYDDSFLDRVYSTTAGELYNVKIQMGQRSAFEAGEMEPQRPGNTEGGMPQMPADGQVDTTEDGMPFPGGDFGGPPDMGDGGEFAPGEGFAPEGMNGMEPPAQPNDGDTGSANDDQLDAVAPKGTEDAAAPDDAASPENQAPSSTQEDGSPPESGSDAAAPSQQDATGGQSTQRGGNRGFGGGMGGGFGGMGGNGGGSLVYTDDDPDSYGSIFENAVSSKVSDNDKQQMITAIQKLNEGEDLEEYWDVDEVLRYFAAHTFVVNLDSYVSNMQQNYYLYERDGYVSILPWDYNLAFGGFNSGNAASVVNFPIDTPVSGVSMEDRPLLNQLLAVEEYKEKYHEYLQQIVDGYVNSGQFAEELERLDTQINDYVKNDTTAFFTYEQYTASLVELEKLVDLRAESVAGQLDGSIPSTSEGQSAEPDLLLDSSSVDFSALGSMGGGGGGMGGERGNRQNREGITQQSTIGNGGESTGEAGAASPPADSAANPADSPFTEANPSINEGDSSFPDGAAMPDMAEIQALMEAAQSGELTDEQKEQLAAMGFSEEMLQNFGQMGGGDGNQNANRAMPTNMSGQGAATFTASDWVIYAVLGILLVAAILLIAFLPRRRLY